MGHTLHESNFPHRVRQMANNYNPKSFWNERFCKYGHTGEVDALLYAYDQPQRISAIDKALARAKVPINDETRILDIGCGTGDLIELLIKFGQPQITAIDISDETIKYAKKRFANMETARFLTMGVEDMDFPADSFDLVIGINILQHIIDEQTFCQVIENIMRVVRVGGHILVMDFSPVRAENRRPAPYVIIRSRREYIDAFEKRGCRLICEFGLPRIGVRLYRKIRLIISGFGDRLTGSKTAGAILETPLRSQKATLMRSHISHLIKVMLLEWTRPFDLLLVPFPSKYTDMGILIFEKAAS